jgi:hypothetical protein
MFGTPDSFAPSVLGVMDFVVLFVVELAFDYIPDSQHGRPQSWFCSPPMAAGQASELILWGIAHLTTAINVERAANRIWALLAGCVTVGLFPGRNDTPALLCPEHVDFVILLHDAPIGGNAINAAVPSVPALGLFLIAKAPLGREGAKLITVLIGDSAYLSKGVVDDVGGRWLEAVGEKAIGGLAAIEPAYVVSDKDVMGVKQFPQIVDQLLVVGLVFAIAWIVWKGATDDLIYFRALPCERQHKPRLFCSDNIIFFPRIVKPAEAWSILNIKESYARAQSMSFKPEKSQ